MRTYRVTNNHIARGVHGSSTYCPIALCLREQNGEYSNPNVLNLTYSKGLLSKICLHKLNESDQRNQMYRYTVSAGIIEWLNNYEYITIKPVSEITICINKDHCYIEGEL